MAPVTVDDRVIADLVRRIDALERLARARSGAEVVPLSSATPQPPGTAAAGSSGEASDAGHVHAKPTAADVGYPSVSGLTAGQVLRATGATAAAFGAVDLADPDAITGDLPDANLSSNVPLLNTANTFTEPQVIDPAASATYALEVNNGLHIIDPATGGQTLRIESTSSAINPVIACVSDAGIISLFYTARSGAANAGETVFQNFSGNPVNVIPYIQMTEITAPAAGAANTGRLFLRDNGSGKTQLCVIFNTGAIQVIATQP